MRQPIIVSFTGATDKHDWVGIFKEGTQPSTARAPKYHVATKGSGTVQVVPPSPGKYFIAMFCCGKFTEIGKRLHVDVDDGTSQSDNNFGYVTPQVTQLATSQTGHVTFQLSVILDKKRAKNLYTIFGENDKPMTIPPAYQIPPPFGAHLGGVNSMFEQYKPEVKYDSWLTIGITGGDFKKWTETQGLNITDGAIFYMDPLEGPNGTKPE